jgi:hypothetical protein
MDKAMKKNNSKIPLLPKIISRDRLPNIITSRNSMDLPYIVSFFTFKNLIKKNRDPLRLIPNKVANPVCKPCVNTFISLTAGVITVNTKKIFE